LSTNCIEQSGSTTLVAGQRSVGKLVPSVYKDAKTFFKNTHPVRELKKLAQLSHKLLVVSTALSQIKSPYPYSVVSPNRITQSLMAVLAGLQEPFLCTETHELGEELLASFLCQVHLYHWLEVNDYVSHLTDRDL
jgi:hypothetical protein